MFELHTEAAVRQALYCPHTGTRIAPSVGSVPPAGTAVAVVVFDDGSTFPLSSNSVIGREPGHARNLIDVDAGGQLIRVNDASQTISRAHVLLEVVGWQVGVVDLGSSNGTYVRVVDGVWQRVVPGLSCWLSSGQSIKLGARTFTVHHTAS